MPFDDAGPESLPIPCRTSAADKGTGFVFARVGVDAEQRLSAAVASGETPPAAAVLWIALLRWLPRDEQRLRRSQSEIAQAAGLSRPTAARAWAELARLGLVVNPHRVGQSTFWEVAADAATKLPEPERRQAALRQGRGQKEAAQAA